MVLYVGSGDYCFSNSLHMSLVGSGARPETVPSPGFLECLTTMPFGYTYLAAPQLFFFDGLDPDQGLTRALAALGWTCRVERGGDAQAALGRLRVAIREGPALLGPLDMGYLTYQPNYRILGGADHFVVALAVEEQHVVVHDPKGYPYATLPLAALLQAWRAERIGYTADAYTLRAGFHAVEAVSRREMIRRSLPLIRANVQRDPAGPQVYGGIRALRLLVELLRAPVPEQLAGHLVHFALPLAVRRKLDAAAFLGEGELPVAAELVAQQARLLGVAQYLGVQQEWPAVAALVEQVTALEERLLVECGTW
jgi:hypothetical protein